MTLPGVIFSEPPQKCELCGTIEECRPYGPNGIQICYDCGMKDKEGTERRMMHYIFGEKEGPTRK